MGEQPVKPKRKRKRWILWLVGAYFLFVGVAVYAVHRVDNESKARRRESCRIQQSQQALLVDLVSQRTGSGGLDLTTLPSYPRLDEPTKAWVDELNALLDSSNGDEDSQTWRKRALKRIGPPIQCAGDEMKRLPTTTTTKRLTTTSS